MSKLLWVLVLVCGLLAAPFARGQGIQINRENRTIAVTVTETVEVEPEIGAVQIGYHNYGRTQDAAYEENGRVAARVIEALLGAGVKREQIETEKVHLEHVDSQDKEWTAEQRKERQFEATQSWTIRVFTAEAQKVVDHAVAAGANEVQDVDWAVADPKKLEAKASAAAVAKARAVAEEMAQKLGSKVGQLLYASNSNAPYTYTANFGHLAGMTLNTEIASLRIAARPKPVLQLFPKKVKRDATVYAVFALE